MFFKTNNDYIIILYIYDWAMQFKDTLRVLLHVLITSSIPNPSFCLKTFSP